MKLKNISARPHWVGDVLIAPGETKYVSDEYANAINRNDLAEDKPIEAEEKPRRQYTRREAE
jgi:hypothetical protein